MHKYIGLIILSIGMTVSASLFSASDVYAKTYTAWATKDRPGKQKLYFGRGTSQTGAMRAVRKMCGRGCVVRKVGAGRCMSIRMDSGRVYRPKGC